MATEFRVVTPDDLGNTLQLNALETNKIDVDVSALDLPEQVTGVTLDNTTLTIETVNGDKTVDLAPIIPEIVADVFLKSVEKDGENLVFVVGNKDNTDNDVRLTYPVSSLYGVHTDGMTLNGDGTQASTLRVNLATDGLLTSNPGGISVDRNELQTVIRQTVPTHDFDVVLTNASGTQTLGYMKSSVA